MSKLMTFVCPELDMTYEAVYGELALHLEQPVEDTRREFAPDDAVANLKYHRRQAARRMVFSDLAAELGVEVFTVFAACSDVDGARLLLDALRAKRPVG